MWFMPVRDSKEAMASRLLQRVMNVTDVVAACRDTGFEWLEQLLDNVLLFVLVIFNRWLYVMEHMSFVVREQKWVVMFIDSYC